MVTGGAGFIGSALILHLIDESDHHILNFDALTYAGVAASLAPVAAHPRYRFVRGDVCDARAVAGAIAGFQPDVIAHLAAESHVDRSIDGPAAFVQTNLIGTFTMLEQALAYWQGLDAPRRAAFRFHHISTDEVFGSLGDSGAFTEDSAYDPRSPYSATKAGADHLVRAWGHTYGLPVLLTNCSNNYGPRQFPEKLIPLTILRAIGGDTLPVYGDGRQVRDWLHVEDHARALRRVFEAGVPGETYNVGGGAERFNIDVVQTICAALDEQQPLGHDFSYAAQIRHVADRPGHDRRYAIDASRIRAELGWAPRETFAGGISRTVAWYLAHPHWWAPLVDRGDATERRGVLSA